MADSKELGIADVPVRPGLGASLHTLQSKDVNSNEGEEGTSPVDIENSIAPTPSIVKIRSNLRTFLVLTSLYVCLPFFHPWKTRTDLEFQLTIFIAALDQTIVSTAIPTIANSLHSARGYTWIGGAYLIANTAGGPIWTKLSDIWGRKPLLLIAVAWFFAASIVCAKATSMKMLIIGRAFQGCAGGGCLNLVIVIMSDLFSLRRRALVIGMLEVM